MPEQDLDTRIRDLVARAVADAPAPPELDAPVALEPRRDGHRLGWWAGAGGAALLAAAAAITVVVLAADTDDRISTPNTQPTVPDTVAAPTTTPSQPAAPTTPPPPPPPTAEGDSIVVTAGPAGVVLHHGAETQTLSTDAMVMALAVGDGTVLVQRSSTPDEDVSGTAPLVLDADDGSLTELFDTVDWEGAVRMHDVELVGGRRLLLFSLSRGPDPQEADEDLYVVDLDSQERTLVAEDVGGWEFGTGRLSLAPSGLIVGESSSGVTRSFVAFAVPGSPAASAPLPAAGDLGLEERDDDCADCPRLFTVLADGATFAWVEGNEVVVRRIGDTEPRGRIPLAATAPCCGSLDHDVVSGDFLLTADLAEQVPVRIAADGSITTLEGTIATAAPAGAEFGSFGP